MPSSLRRRSSLRTAVRSSRRAVFSVAPLLLWASMAGAATLSWDPGTTPGTPSGGSGTWDLTTANWSNGSADQAWPNTTGDTAIFGGAAGGTVTLGTTITLGAISFQTDGYTLTGGTLNFGGAATITLAAGLNETIASNISNSGGNAIPTISGATGSTMTLSGLVGGSNGATLTLSNGGTTTLGGTADNSYLGATVNSGTALVLAKTSSSGTHALGNNTTINGSGTLQLAGSGNDQIYDGVVVTMNSGATFDLNGCSETVGAVAGTGTVTNTATTGGTLVLGGFSKNSDLTNVLLQDGAGMLNLTTGATTTLGTANTYTGVTTINGTTNVPVLANGGTSSSIGASSNAAANLVISYGGVLNYTGASVTTDRSVTLGAYGGAINVANASTTLGFAGAAGGLTTGGLGTVAFSGPVTGSVTVNGGTAILSGTNDNNGLGATVTSGTLVLNKTSNGSTHALGNSTTVNGGVLQLAGSGGDQIYSGVTVTLTSGALDLNGQSEGFNQLKIAGTGINGGGALVNSAAATTGTLSAPVTLTGNTSAGGVGNVTISSVVADGGSGYALTKVGAGTLTLTNTNTYTGTTTVSNGTLVVNNDGTTAGKIAGPIQVNTGGTLLLSGANTHDRVGDTAGTTLGGGTFAIMGGAKEGAATTVSSGTINTSTANAVGLGALTLSGSSTLDFGSGSTGNLLVFANFAANSGTLTITNWDNANYNASTMTSGQNTDDRLVFGQQLTQAQLNAFDFGSGAGVNVSEISLGNGFYEVGGIVAVPEPATVFGGLALLCVVGYRERRRFLPVRA